MLIQQFFQRKWICLSIAAIALTLNIVFIKKLNAEPSITSTIKLASTTSTDNSGFFKFILPRFARENGIKVHVIAVGTGQALEIGRRGDADALLVHNRKAEEEFVAQGYGLYRKDVMYNDFVIIGPYDALQKISKREDIRSCLRIIAESGVPFVSRGDNSGTHAAELSLWQAAGIRIEEISAYKESGSGMGATLNLASGLNAFTLSDRSTWEAFKNRAGLTILCEGDPMLFNPYGVILLNPQLHEHINEKAAEKFVNWLIGGDGQRAIAAFRINGKQTFFPNANR